MPGPCRLAGATPAAICEDEPAPGGHSCKQQAAWGKCGEAWIRQGGWCAATCGRCSQGSALAKAERTPDTILTDAAPAANATASSLPDNTAEYGKVGWRSLRSSARHANPRNSHHSRPHRPLCSHAGAAPLLALLLRPAERQAVQWAQPHPVEGRLPPGRPRPGCSAIGARPLPLAAAVCPPMVCLATFPVCIQVASTTLATT